jgi:hypothetical protein
LCERNCSPSTLEREARGAQCVRVRTLRAPTATRVEWGCGREAFHDQTLDVTWGALKGSSLGILTVPAAQAALKWRVFVEGVAGRGSRMAAHRNRSTADFDAFYAATAAGMVRWLVPLTGDLAEAEDVTQEAYERAWLHWLTVSDCASPGAGSGRSPVGSRSAGGVGCATRRPRGYAGCRPRTSPTSTLGTGRRI